MYNAQMATKTISLKLEAYERLREARRYPTESFSQVVMRAAWPGDTVTGRDLLARYRAQGAHFAEDELEAIERLKAEQRPPEDKWSGR